MASRKIWAGLLLCTLLGLIQADDGATKKPVSTLYNDQLGTTLSINLPTDSEDVNFFLSSPLYSWFGIGFSSSMAGSPMLIFYSSADGRGVTVSPRYATGETEPAYNSSMKVAIAGSTVNNGTFAVAGTCTGCRQWPGDSTSQTFILAWGADADFLATDDLAPRVKQHSGYGRFVMDIKQATGPGGTDMLLALGASQNSDGAHLDGDLQADNSNHGGLPHGIVMALATLVVAPIDILTAGALRRWPMLHAVTSTIMMAFILAGMGLGIQMSRLYIATQQYRTAHQVLGLLAIVAMFLVGVVGVFYRLIVKSAAKRGQHPPEKSGLLGKVHRWVGRFVWVIMLVNNALGLQFAAAGKTLIIGYVVLAVGVLVLISLIRWTIHCCTRQDARDEEEEHKAAIELAQFYGTRHHEG